MAALAHVPHPAPDAALLDDADAALLHRLAAGEVAALDTLYTRYARPVFALAVRVLGDEADAEEVTQDVFERVWWSADRFDPTRGSAGRWLISIAYYVTMNALRTRYRRPRLCHMDAAEPWVQRLPDAVDVAGLVVDRLEGAQLHRAVRSLPPPQQQAVALAYFGGLSQAEVATTLNASLGTVKSHTRRGLTRLRASVAAFGLVPAGDDTAVQA